MRRPATGGWLVSPVDEGSPFGRLGVGNLDERAAEIEKLGLALDAEWAVDAGEVPGEVIDSTTGAELDFVAEYLSSLVRTHDLPEKVMVYHHFHTATIISMSSSHDVFTREMCGNAVTVSHT